MQSTVLGASYKNYISYLESNKNKSQTTAV